MPEETSTEVTRPDTKTGHSHRQIKVSRIKQNRFLRHYAKGGTLTESFQVSGLARSSYLRLRDDDEDFQQRLELAENTSTDLLIKEARRRAVEGVTEPTGWYKGVAGGVVQRYSDNLLMFLVKERRPEFRDKFELTGQGGQPLQIQVSAYTPPPAPQKGYESVAAPAKEPSNPEQGPGAPPIEVEVDRGDDPK